MQDIQKQYGMVIKDDFQMFHGLTQDVHFYTRTFITEISIFSSLHKSMKKNAQTVKIVLKLQTRGSTEWPHNFFFKKNAMVTHYNEAPWLDKKMITIFSTFRSHRYV